MTKNQWRQWAALLAALYFTTGSPAAPAPDDAHDLRGPAPKKGQVYVDHSVFTMKNADISIAIGGINLEGKMDMTHTTEKNVEFLGVDGRKVVKLRTKVLKDETKRKTNIGGEAQDETEKRELTGEIVFSELTKDGWKHTLEDTKPSEKQLKELKSFEEPLPDDDLYPDQKIKVGHAWDVSAEALKKVLGSKVEKIAGKGKSKFLRIEKVGDEDCAVVETELEIKATMKEDENLIDVDLKGKVTVHRSIKHCVDLKSHMDGSATFAGKIDEDGMKADIKFSGKLIANGKTEIKKP